MENVICGSESRIWMTQGGYLASFIVSVLGLGISLYWIVIYVCGTVYFLVRCMSLLQT